MFFLSDDTVKWVKRKIDNSMLINKKEETIVEEKSERHIVRFEDNKLVTLI